VPRQPQAELTKPVQQPDVRKLAQPTLQVPIVPLDVITFPCDADTLTAAPAVVQEASSVTVTVNVPVPAGGVIESEEELAPATEQPVQLALRKVGTTLLEETPMFPAVAP